MWANYQPQTTPTRKIRTLRRSWEVNPDLLIAATAELAGLTVLHVDKDFEIIAQITGQRVERLKVPRA